MNDHAREDDIKAIERKAYQAGFEAGIEACDIEAEERAENAPESDVSGRLAYARGERAGYRRGYDEGFQAAKGPRLPAGRPPKYGFHKMEIGDKIVVDESQPHKVYLAARSWAARNGPTRRFKCKPVEGGTEVERVF